MSRKTSAVISAAFSLFMFTVLPIYAPRIIPPEFIAIMSEVGINIHQFANELALIGGIIAVLTLVRGFTEPSSILYLLASIASSGVTFVFTVITVSLGRIENLGNLGITTMTMEVQGTMNTITLDFRVFIWLTAATVAMKVIEALLEYADTKKQKQVVHPSQQIEIIGQEISGLK